MKKTVFISQSQNVSRSGIPCMSAPYIFYSRGKWQEDLWYYTYENELKIEAKKQGHLIK
jgi:hypothetical protein